MARSKLALPQRARHYGEVDLSWVRFLSILRATGMPIRRMLTFVGLETERDTTIEVRRALLEAHRGVVARWIEDLERTLGAIDAKRAHYRDVSNSCIYSLETAVVEKDGA